MHVTTIICTWNRCALLEKTLGQMTALRIPAAVRWELLVVDNNCTDRTAEVTASFQDRLPIRRVSESKVGLSNARNRGVESSQGDLILFTDDDVLVEEDWLAAHAAAAERWPAAGFFGGRVDPWFERPPAAALAEALAPVAAGFCSVNLGPDERPLLPEELVIKGANFGFRRAAAASLRFNPDLGPHGEQWGGADETAFCEQILAAGSQGIWVPGAVVKHFVPRERLSLKSIRGYYRGLGITYVRRGQLDRAASIAGLPRWVLRRYATVLAKRLLGVVRRGTPWHYRLLAEQWHLEGILLESRQCARHGTAEKAAGTRRVP
jgi:glycosyltransferase involved in cell wall biosynthesis